MLVALVLLAGACAEGTGGTDSTRPVPDVASSSVPASADGDGRVGLLIFAAFGRHGVASAYITRVDAAGLMHRIGGTGEAAGRDSSSLP